MGDYDIMANSKCYVGKCWHGLSVMCLSALAGIMAPLIFILVMTLVGLLQPDYSAIQETISQLVLGRYGWFQAMSFFIVGFLLVVFAFRLYNVTLRTIYAKVGFVFFVISSLGFFLMGAFPVKPDEVVFTISALLHSIAVGIVVTSFILGGFAYSIYFRADLRWSRFWLYTLLTAIACLAFLMLWLITPQEWLWKGLSERLLVVTSFVWIGVVSVKLLKFCLNKL